MYFRVPRGEARIFGVTYTYLGLWRRLAVSTWLFHEFGFQGVVHFFTQNLISGVVRYFIGNGRNYALGRFRAILWIFECISSTFLLNFSHRK